MKFLVIFGFLFAVGSHAKANEFIPLMKRKPRELIDHPYKALPNRTAQRLAKAELLIGESEYDLALDKLNRLEKYLKKRHFELAQVYRVKGFLYAQQERYHKAAKYFKKFIDLDVSPKIPTLAVLLSYGQIQGSLKNYKQAIIALQDYISNSDTPRPEVHVMYAQTLALVKLYPNALATLKKAISLSEVAREPWYQLQVALHYELKHKKSAAKTLLTMINLFPDKKKYWKQLSGIFMELGEHRFALAVLELAHKRKQLTQENEINQLVSLYLFLDMPYKAAILLSQSLQNKMLTRTEQNYLKLADSFIAAQELDKALPALKQAALLGGNGNIFLRQGLIYIEKEMWQDAANSIQAALSKGGLDEPGFAYLYLGVAHLKLDNLQEARNHFKKAAGFKKSKPQAKQWLSYMDEQESQMKMARH